MTTITPRDEAANPANPATWMPQLRENFAPIAVALTSLAAVAGEIDAVLRRGDTPTPKQLKLAARIGTAIVNHSSLDGVDLEEAASEVWQYASLLTGDLKVASNGDAV